MVNQFVTVSKFDYFNVDIMTIVSIAYLYLVVFIIEYVSP